MFRISPINDKEFQKKCSLDCGADFSPDEVGRIEKMEVSRQELSENGPTVFRSVVSVLREASQKNALENSDLNTRLAYLREKKAKLHKGKVEQK